MLAIKRWMEKHVKTCVPEKIPYRLNWQKGGEMTLSNAQIIAHIIHYMRNRTQQFIDQLGSSLIFLTNHK